MRVSLPLMLTVSLLLHGAVATVMTYRHFHLVMPSVEAISQVPSLVLLTSEEAPDRQQTPAAKPMVVHAVSTDVTSTAPSPPRLVAKSASGPHAPPPTSLALEANPNAHIRPVPSESVLSPNPAPHLNNRAGVVFLLDISGSMYERCAGSTRLAMAREILSRRIRDLKDGTPFAITVYAQTARNSGPLVAANTATREAAVRFINEDIDCGGGTDLPAGLTSAMKLGMGNLVLVTDGDLNTTLPVLMDKARSILNPADHGPALTVVGISPRANSDAASLLQSLANLTGGTYVTEQYGASAELLTSAKTEITTP